MLEQLLAKIDSSIADFNKSIPNVEKSIYNAIVDLTKDFYIPAKNTKQRIENYRTLQKINKKIEDVVFTDEYSESLKKFVKSFDDVKKIQTKYFNEITLIPDKELYNEIKTTYQKAALENLGDSAVSKISQEIKDMLLETISSGGSYKNLLSNISTYLNGKDGALVKYSKQVTTDAINQYSAAYTKTVTEDLGLEWYRYVGSLIKTSRPFCTELVKKDYVHISELPSISSGVIDGMKVSTDGMIPGTNAATFPVYRGGYNCGHQLYPVSKYAVPLSIRRRFEKS